jgi:hypothetical protein
MKKIKSIFAVLTTVLILASCSISRPVLVTDNASEKEGVSEFSVILGIFRPKEADISIKKAAENGGITKVATVDFKIESKFFKTTYKTIVTGN